MLIDLQDLCDEGWLKDTDLEPVAGLRPLQLSALKDQLEAALRDALTLRVPVRMLRPGALPRFEFKSRRWIKELPIG